MGGTLRNAVLFLSLNTTPKSVEQKYRNLEVSAVERTSLPTLRGEFLASGGHWRVGHPFGACAFNSEIQVGSRALSPLLFYKGISCCVLLGFVFGKALSVVSQKWSFSAALVRSD